MSERERYMLLAYFHNRYIYLESELQEVRNRFIYRSKLDELDLLEYQIALVTLRSFAEFKKDVCCILKLN